MFTQNWNLVLICRHTDSVVTSSYATLKLWETTVATLGYLCAQLQSVLFNYFFPLWFLNNVIHLIRAKKHRATEDVSQSE